MIMLTESLMVPTLLDYKYFLCYQLNLPTDCNVVADAIIVKFVQVSIPTNEPISNNDTSRSNVQDSVYAYATDYLTMALLWYGFHDAIKMGDGNRILSYWKFLTAIFKQTGHYNYAKEGFLMLAQSALKKY